MKLRIRDWPVRAKVVALVAPALVSLLALWVFATGLTAGTAIGVAANRTVYDGVVQDARAMTFELQRERKLSQVYLGSGRTDRKAITDQRSRTDAAVASFKRHAGSSDVRNAATDTLRRRIGDVFAALDEFARGREAIDLVQMDRPGAMQLYGTAIASVYRMFDELDSGDVALRSAIDLSRARDLLAQEDALLSGVAAAGKFAAGEQTDLVQVVGAQRVQFGDASARLPSADADAYQLVARGDTAQRLRALEDRLVAEAKPNQPVPIDMSVWRTSYDKVVDDLRAVEQQATESALERSRPAGTGAYVRLGIVALGGLLALAVSVLMAVSIGRSLVRRLHRLRRATQELADMRRGDRRVDFGTDEIGAVADALAAVQHAAARSAAKEAQLRQGLSEVFLNIARRSQTLLHRQLALLDRMERRATDPEELEDLFRADHLATRMRRHAEDLVILAGATPGRGWRNPVPMVDVVRGAVSEVEDYARVGLLALPNAWLAGRAVADVIHLLAELIENATSYSPPHTKVQVGGQLVPNGFALEIEDRGLGMAPEALDDANERLLHPPDFDPAHSARLGLLVVALLSTRHGIRVTLRASPYGGVTAVVLVPPDLIVDGSGRALPSGHATLGTAPEGPTVAEKPLPEPMAPVLMLERSSAAPEPPVPAEQVPVTAVSTSDVELTEDGLPRRHRQANLAPQLRQVPSEAVPVQQAERSPERIRAMMSSFQAGMVRGRRDAARLTDGGAPDEAALDEAGTPAGPTEREAP
jgi:signal transduction histidine kinase